VCACATLSLLLQSAALGSNEMATDLDAASRRTLKKKLWDPLGIVPPGGALWKAAVGISPKWWQWKKKWWQWTKKVDAVGYSCGVPLGPMVKSGGSGVEKVARDLRESRKHNDL
jgi:hypothetical protein